MISLLRQDIRAGNVRRIDAVAAIENLLVIAVIRDVDFAKILIDVIEYQHVALDRMGLSRLRVVRAIVPESQIKSNVRVGFDHF